MLASLFSNVLGWDAQNSHTQGPIGRRVNIVLVSLSKRACVHPIYTIAFFAILASTTYLTFIESTLFGRGDTAYDALGKIDFNYMLKGSKQLYAGAETDWKWSVDTPASIADDQLSLITLVFPDSAPGSYKAAPQPRSITIPPNSSARSLPCSSNRLSPISYDLNLAFSLPVSETSSFLDRMQELAVSDEEAETRYLDDNEESEERKKWIMKAVRSPGSLGVRNWIREAWADFLDLLKNAETLDIIIMFLGYLAMHLTFISLFASMRRLGSHFWLAFTVMLSGLFAFLFALVVTIRIGVPISMVLLSEGLPFLVVTVGFEKPIMLTKAVLSASFDKKRRGSTRANGSDNYSKLPSIKDAVQVAVKENGWIIVRDYAIEIAILIWGVASGVQGGLRQFCFLAAWTLFFDCILLFTFYTAILTVKLEINRIKRHVELRKALEDDGVSRRVAENVARGNDWPQTNGGTKPAPDSDPDILFGKRGEREIPKFKLYTVGGFALLNVLNLLTIPFRKSDKPSTIMGACFNVLTSLVSQPDMDPFKVAGSGLNSILATAEKNHKSILVTILNPIKYELEYPSIHYGPRPNTISHAIAEDAGQMFDGMGGKAIEGVLKSFEDPVLSKWIIIALIFSLSLNGYLFNAARWTIKEPVERDEPAKESEVLDNPISTQKLPGELTPLERAQSVASEEGDSLDKSALQITLQQRNVPSTLQLPTRTTEECESMLAAKRAKELTDEELIALSLRGKLPGYALEKTLGDMTRAVKIRRAIVSRTHATRHSSTFLERSKLPYESFDYERVHGACCENVIGYMPLPVGVAGPLNVDGQNYFLPMATTEGVLVASASRGCKAINAGGGVVTVLTGDGMTRGPCVGFDTLSRAGEAKLWLDSSEGQKVMKEAFDSTSRFARLQTLRTALAGTYLFIRFKTTTGDAMGMNMISKGVEHALKVMSTEAGFDDMAIISVSGNFCTDKKPAAINWIDGRGKSVVAEAIIPGEVVRSVLKSDVNALVELNVSKNLIGSAMAGSIGGFNAHAANIVAAIFLATGQDPAQVVESANCITVMKNVNGNLQISVSMPSIEVGTIGGGTILEPQSAMLDLLGVRGPNPTNPGENARQLARIVAAGVLAGELSLCSALAAGHLVRAHMSHNRSNVASRAGTPAPMTPVSLTPVTAGSGAATAPGSPNGGGLGSKEWLDKQRGRR